MDRPARGSLRNLHSSMEFPQMSAPSIECRFLSRDDVARRLGLKDGDTVVRLHREQGLPAHRVARRLLFDPAEVDAWVRSRSGSGTTTGPEIASPLIPESWVAEQVSKFAPDELRRAAVLLTSLASAVESARPAPEGASGGDSA